MALNELFREWIERAEEDFGFASKNLEELTNPYLGPICYHFQQAAEKYLKAYIVAHDMEFRKIHDLTELVNICAEKDPSFSLAV